jgi:hypothetical protein
LILLAGCSEVTYPVLDEPRALVIHGMLLTNTDRQEIVVEYTRPIQDGFFRGITPASGARVVVEGAGTHVYQEDLTRPGIYRASYVPRPGQRYTLRIEDTDGAVATSVTTVPAVPTLFSPSADTAVGRYDDVVLRWNAAPGAPGYVWIATEPGDSSFISGSAVEDTTVTLQLGLFAYNFGDELRLSIASVDSHYLEYNPGGLLPGDRYQLRTTIDGGWGLFGSAAFSGPPRNVTLK